MKHIKQYLFLLALLITTHIAFGQSIDYTKADAAINLFVDSNKFSGVVLIAEKGKVKFKKAAGYINYAEQKN
jgi:hypothetical protein